MDDFDDQIKSIQDGIRRIRFFKKVQKDHKTGCWNWIGNKKRNGLLYGLFYWSVAGEGEEKLITAHRASWIFHNGMPPDGKHILHSCNNPSCVNPAHLRLGSHQDNMDDRQRAGRTSSGDRRYNWKRNAKMLADIKAAISKGLSVQDAANELGIGYQTVYRARDQDPELKALMAETKSARYKSGWEKRR